MAEPLFVACLRAVDLHAEVDGVTGEVTRDVPAMTASAADWAALEYALRLADARGGRVVAVSVVSMQNSESAESAGVLAGAAAVGATALRVDAPTSGYVADLVADERAVAHCVLEAIGRIGVPDVVVCGDRSADRGTGAVPAFLAAELGYPQALGLVSMSIVDDELLGERRLDGGRRERLRIPTPAVCSVEAAGVRLRRAGLAATLRAAPVEVHAGAAPAEVDAVPRLHRPRTRPVPPPAGGVHERLAVLTGVLGAHEPPTVVGPLDADAAADAILDFLEQRGYRTGAA
jgi:electron transfer flavoprotein beta subunit